MNFNLLPIFWKLRLKNVTCMRNLKNLIFGIEIVNNVVKNLQKHTGN